MCGMWLYRGSHVCASQSSSSQPARGHAAFPSPKGDINGGFPAPGVCRNDWWVVCASSVGCQMPIFYVFLQRGHRNARKIESCMGNRLGQSVNLLSPPVEVSPKWPLYPRGIHAELTLSVRLHGYQCARWCTALSSPSWALLQKKIPLSAPESSPLRGASTIC